MEEWQRTVLRKNRPSLIKSIDCNDLFIGELFSRNVLSEADIDQLKAEKRNGQHAQTALLLDILGTRKSGYEHLTGALHESKQTGALLTLLQGIEDNIPESSPFKMCGIELDLDRILSQINSIKSCSVALSTLLNSVDKVQLQEIIYENMDVKSYETLMYSSKPVFEIARDTIPKQIPYYIPRSVTLRTRLDPNVFRKLNNDIFLVENIEAAQLTSLAMKSTSSSNVNSTHSIVSTDKSSNQKHKLTTRFILLDHPDHFEDICKLSKHPVHWVRYDTNCHFYHVKSSAGGGMQNIKRHLDNTEEILSEKNFIDLCLKTSKFSPIIKYDSPGMGKTILLSEMARKVKELRPTSNVIFIAMSDLINGFDWNKEKIDGDMLKRYLLDVLTSNKLGRSLQAQLFDCPTHSIELFLDAFDEVYEKDRNTVKKILTCAVNGVKNVRVYLTTRPQHSTELEDLFGVPGYNFQPFQEKDQVDFFVRYWESEHNLSATEETRALAGKCLQAFNSEVDKSDRDIAGIPLQCKMLSELYLPYAKSKEGNLETSKFHIKSIYRMYKSYIQLKFSSVQYDAKERKNLYDYHAFSSFELLFPGSFNLVEKNVNSSLNMEKVFKIGILEYCPTSTQKVTFVHRTFAEFLAAEALIAWLQYGVTDCNKSLSSLLFKDVFHFEANFQHRELDTNFAPGQSFTHATVVRFFDCSIIENGLYENILESIRKTLTDSEFFCLEFVRCIFIAAVIAKSRNLSELFLDIFLHSRALSGPSWRQKEFGKLNHLSECNYLWPRIDKDKIYRPSHRVVISSTSAYTMNVAVLQGSLDLIELICQLRFNTLGLSFGQDGFLWKDEILIKQALKYGHYYVVEYLIQKCSSKHVFDCRPLHACIKYSYFDSMEVIKEKIQIMKLLLKKYPDILKLVDKDGYSPLLVHRSHLELIKYLLSLRINIYETTKENKNIAHLMATYVNPEEYHELIVLLLNQTNSVNNQTGKLASPIELFHEKDKHNECTPIQVALQYNHLLPRTLDLLITHKINLDFSNKAGNTILHQAAYGRTGANLLIFIIERNLCNLLQQNFHGDTFMHILLHVYVKDKKMSYFRATEIFEPQDMVEYLYHNNQTEIFRIRNKDGLLPVELIVQLSDVSMETIQLLVNATGLGINFLNKFGQTLLFRVFFIDSWVKSLEIVKNLISLGVNKRVTDQRGNIFLHYVWTHRIIVDSNAYHDLFEYLISNNLGDLLTIKNETGCTTLHIGDIIRCPSELLPETLHLLSGNSAAIKNHLQNTSGLYSLKNYFDRNDIEKMKNHALHLAVSNKKSIKFMKALIENDLCDAYSEDLYGHTFLQTIACIREEDDFLEIVNFLINIGHADILHQTDSSLKSLLHIRARNFEISEKTFQLLTTQGLNINNVDREGSTVLMEAVKHKKCSVDCLKRIIQFGASTTVQDKRGHTFIHNTFKSADDLHEILLYLVENDLGEVIKKTTNSNKTALHFAVGYANLNTLDFLIDTCGLNVNAVDNSKESVLHSAVKNDASLETIRHCVFRGADWQVKNSNGQNLAHFSLISCKNEIRRCCCNYLEYFIGLGINIDEQDNDGNSLLHYATMPEFMDYTHSVARFLMSRGANQTLKNNKGSIPACNKVYVCLLQ